MAKRCLGCMGLYGDEFEVCPHCGFVEGTPAEEKIHMDPGFLLHERYLIGKVLGYGGFGVTYLGWDIQLEQKVAIKEYLPSEFSTRMPNHARITVFSGDKAEQFRTGLNKFTEEAQRLAKFTSEDGIVRIFDSFRENGTAYIVMEYLDGETLGEYLEREGKIPEDEAIRLLTPVMESLKTLHARNLLHRDISPDNIFLTRSGEVKLIDFGASRYSTATHSRSLTVMIKPGFSPEEQYRSRGDQGPYTDVYAIAATLYRMITGKTPPDAIERRASFENKNRDILIEPHKLEPGISDVHEVAILNAMNIRIEDRTPDIDTFLEELHADTPARRRAGKIRKLNFYRWPLWLKILVPAGFVCVAAFLVLLFTGVILPSRYSSHIDLPEGMVQTPDVELQEQDEAIRILEEAGLLAKVAGTEESPYIASGLVVRQVPGSGMNILVNETVSLYISSGNGVVPAKNGIATVPYVVGDSKEAALTKFTQASLGDPIIKEKYDNYIAAGSVISVSISAGDTVPAGEVLELVISLGPEPFTVPDVTQMEEEEARRTLEALGLIVQVEYEEDPSAAAGTVLRVLLPGSAGAETAAGTGETGQETAADTKVKYGDTVILIVASAQETVQVPDVTGFSEAAARASLEAAGFTVETVQNYDETVALGNVIGQTPAAYTSQTPGTRVILYVSLGAQQTEEPQEPEVTQSQPPSPTNPPTTTTTTEAPTQEKPAKPEKPEESEPSGDNPPAEQPTEKPTKTPDPAVEPTTKVLYRYREKEFTASESDELPGWEYYNSKIEKGEWVDRGVTYEEPFDSATEEVQYETAKIPVWQYKYTRYGESGSPYSGDGNPEYDQENEPLPIVENSEYPDVTAYLDRQGTYWFYEEPFVAYEMVEYHYQTRTVTMINYFWRWSDWSAWSETPVMPPDSNMEVETSYSS